MSTICKKRFPSGRSAAALSTLRNLLQESARELKESSRFPRSRLFFSPPTCAAPPMTNGRTKSPMPGNVMRRCPRWTAFKYIDLRNRSIVYL